MTLIAGNYTLVADPTTWKELPTETVRLFCDTTLAPVIITLPPISQLLGFWNVKIFVVDVSNNAVANNITVNADASNTIDTGASIIININGASSEIQAISDTKWMSLESNVSSGGLTGDPNAIVFFNPLRTAAMDNPKFVAAPIDAFGRPVMIDNRNNGPTGSVWKQGSWQTDGDPTNQIGEGVVLYGANANGAQGGGNGGYGRFKPDRFGIAQIIVGVNGDNLFYAWRTDYTGTTYKNDLAAVTYEINRARGTSRTAKGITANRPAAANVGEQWFDTSLGANGGKPIWFVGGGLWVDASGALV
jgi:hypothetical protein